LVGCLYNFDIHLVFCVFSDNKSNFETAKRILFKDGEKRFYKTFFKTSVSPFSGKKAERDREINKFIWRFDFWLNDTQRNDTHSA
jgi:hypothetical protein